MMEKDNYVSKKKMDLIHFMIKVGAGYVAAIHFNLTFYIIFDE